MTDIDPEQTARMELMSFQVPAPDDLVDGLTPLAQLLYLQQLAYTVLGGFAAGAIDTLGADEAPGATVSATVGALNLICGEIDAACEPLGLLPDGWDGAPVDA